MISTSTISARLTREYRGSVTDYRQLFDRNPRPMWVLERTTLTSILVNDAACTAYGWTRDELIGRSIAELWPPADRAAVAEPLPKAARHVTRDGRELDVEIEVAEVDHDGRTALLVVISDVTERRLHRLAIERSAEGFIVVNSDGTLRYLSPSAERLLGRSASEMVGKRATSFAHPDDARVAKGPPPGESGVYLSRAVLSDGSYCWIEAATTNLRDEPGVRGFVTTFRDVTRRVDAERALQDANSRLEFLLSATNAVTYTARPGIGPATFMSANVREVTGWDAAAYHEPQFWISHVHADDVPAIRDGIARLYATGAHVFDYRFRHADGTYRWLHDSVRLVYDRDGAPLEMIGHFMDDSVRRNAEESLRRSEANFRMLIERAPTITIVHTDGVIAYVNPAACALLGYDDANDLIGRHVLELIPPDDHPIARANIAHTAREGHTRSDPLRIRRRDGTLVTIDGSAHALAFDGKAAHVVLARDVTERSELFTRLAVADRMLSVGTLAAGVAHEINNPLAFVVSNLALLAEQLPRLLAGDPSRLDRAAVEELLLDAREGASRVSAIVRDLRALARPDDVVTTDVDVAKVLASSIRMASNELRHRARVTEHVERAPLVKANESRLGQVFLNLLVNAAQAIPEGRAESNEVRVWLAASADDRRAIVEIEDTGVGIPSHVIGRIFDPFFTTKPVGVGMGLGLAISHQIVTSFGGEISVASTPGHGARFRIVLPASGAASADANASGPLQPIEAVAATRVLMIDDEPAVGRSTRALLAPEYDITPVTRAVDGLALLAHGKFDAILCDLMMPEMSGMEFWERLAPHDARRVVFLTGGAFTEQARAFLSTVSQPHLEKPFREHDLRRAIEAVRRSNGDSS